MDILHDYYCWLLMKEKIQFNSYSISGIFTPEIEWMLNRILHVGMLCLQNKPIKIFWKKMFAYLLTTFFENMFEETHVCFSCALYTEHLILAWVILHYSTRRAQTWIGIFCNYFVVCKHCAINHFIIAHRPNIAIQSYLHILKASCMVSDSSFYQNVNHFQLSQLSFHFAV